ncbi:MAG: nucleoside phosphorylase [Acidimicrobiales bacterium]
MNRTQWLAALGIGEEEVPHLVVLEGSWWRAERNRQRLALLDDVRELAFPEFHLGRYRDVAVLYSCAYGAPRAVEPVHVCAELGTPTVVQIGSCGSLQSGMATGDIVVPERATIGEGASQYYGGKGVSEATPALVEAAEEAFTRRGLRVHRGPHFTTSALFAQPPERVQAWHDAGHLAVDMETSAVFSAARHFGMQAVSLLFVWDDLLRNRSWLDPFSPEEQQAQERANAALMEVALEIGAGAT